ncbi:hypothetical protein MNQ95_08085 [Pseudoxanthomonas daejeonensis]|uniref:hypothetical protein n=1 Tax=Pseudoxanthomonas daejeonensis TaxID=266062 RepID=UPI001F540E1D|nr:hypothetical protein [Pseudoxanthomonas daejeonensis]UNK56141.1 hypothetical protein MNQ95_08085 [Pseudoxanthomonas daejeonensis]
MNTTRHPLSLSLVATLLVALPASSAPSAGPETQVWIDVATHNQAGMPDMGQMMGGMGGIAAKMMGGAQGTIGYPDARHPVFTGKFFDIAMRNSLAPGKDAEQQVPAGLGLGASLPLLPPVASRGRETGGTSGVPEGEIHLKYYWGCGSEVRAGQPREVHMRAKDGKFEMSGDPMQGRYAPDRGIDPDPSYVLWPNPKTQNRAPANASLVGQHRITGPGVPESLTFELQQAADFMPKIALTQSGQLASGLTLGWQPVDRAKAYFLHGLSMQDKTIVIWSSAEVPDAGQGVVDFLTGGQVDRWLKEKVLLPPSTTSCAIPKGIFADASTGQASPGILSMIAYGPETHITWPPKPADPKQPWDPEWNVRVRTKSTAGALLGMDLSGMEGMDAGDAASPQDPGQKKPEEGATKKLLKGLLRNL